MTRLSRLPAQHGPLFFQHADDLKGLVVNFDAFAEGRFAAKQVGGHVAADDTDRLAAFGIGGGQKPALGHVHAAGLQIGFRGADDRARCRRCGFCISPVRRRPPSGATACGQGQLPGQRLGVLEPDGRAALLHFQPVVVGIVEPVVARHVKHIRARARKCF